MANIGFIGLGPMGLPMAKNLIKKGHIVKGFDSSKAALKEANEAGIQIVSSIAEASKDVQAVFVVLEHAEKSREIFLGDEGIVKSAAPGTILVDCSNAYGVVSHDVHEAAERAGLDLLDAPAEGGIEGAQGGNLSFMVRGDEKAFLEGEPLLATMGKKIYHDGPWSRQFKKSNGGGEGTRVVYKKKPKWKGIAVLLVFLFLGGNAIILAEVEESVVIRNGELRFIYDLNDAEYSLFCRGTRLLGLDIDGC